jgi:hypothetical protein
MPTACHARWPTCDCLARPHDQLCTASTEVMFPLLLDGEIPCVACSWGEPDAHDRRVLSDKTWLHHLAR